MLQGKTKFWSGVDSSVELNALGLRIREVAADGNCFFRSLSDQLTGHESDHGELRSKVVRFIEDHQDDFQPFVEDDEDFDDYVARMKKDSTWAGHMEVQAASLVLEYNLKIYQEGQPVWSVVNFPDSDKWLHLSYHDGMHYNSVRSITDPGGGPAQPIELPAIPASLSGSGGSQGQSKEEGPRVDGADVELVMRSTGCTDRGKAIEVLTKCKGNVGKAISKLSAQLAVEFDAAAEALDEGSSREGGVESTPEVEKQQAGAAAQHVSSRHIESDQASPSRPCSSLERVILELTWKTSKSKKTKVQLHVITGDEDLDTLRAELLAKSNRDKGKGGALGETKPNQACPCGSKKKYKNCCGTGRRSKAVLTVHKGKKEPNGDEEGSVVAQLKELCI